MEKLHSHWNYLKKYNYKALTFLFIGNLEILHKRFLERDNSPERGKANKINGLLDEFSIFKTSVKPLTEFNIGDKLVKIDTSDTAVRFSIGNPPNTAAKNYQMALVL